TSAGGRDVFVAKYLADGTFAWAQRLGGALDDSDQAYVALDAAGNPWVAGGFCGTADFGPYTLSAFTNSQDIFVAKLDGSSGAVQKALQVGSHSGVAGGTTSGWAQGLTLDAGGNVFVTGVFFNTVDFDPDPAAQYNLTPKGADSRDAFVLKLDP